MGAGQLHRPLICCSSALVDLCQDTMIAFGQSPPLYAKPAASARPPVQTPPEPPSSSFSAQNPLHRCFHQDAVRGGAGTRAQLPARTSACRPGLHVAAHNLAVSLLSAARLFSGMAHQSGLRGLALAAQAVGVRLWQWPHAAAEQQQQQHPQCPPPVGPCCGS